MLTYTKYNNKQIKENILALVCCINSFLSSCQEYCELYWRISWILKAGFVLPHSQVEQKQVGPTPESNFNFKCIYIKKDCGLKKVLGPKKFSSKKILGQKKC